MAERRTRTIMAAVEESIYEAASNYASRIDLSTSAYLRSLIVRDLIEKGLIPEEEVVRMASGA